MCVGVYGWVNVCVCVAGPGSGACCALAPMYPMALWGSSIHTTHSDHKHTPQHNKIAHLCTHISFNVYLIFSVFFFQLLDKKLSNVWFFACFSSFLQVQQLVNLCGFLLVLWPHLPFSSHFLPVFLFSFLQSFSMPLKSGIATMHTVKSLDKLSHECIWLVLYSFKWKMYRVSHASLNVFFCPKFLHESLWGLSHFWSQPQVAIRGTAVFGTLMLASFSLSWKQPKECFSFQEKTINKHSFAYWGDAR